MKRSSSLDHGAGRGGRKRNASKSKSKSPQRYGKRDGSQDTHTSGEDDNVSPRGWHAAGKKSDIEKLLKEINMKKTDEWMGTGGASAVL